MAMIISICIISLLLYKSGYITKLLDCFRLDEIPIQYQVPRKTNKSVPVLNEREQLEKQAAFIVSEMGEDPRTVVYMGENLLRSLIRDYNKEINKMKG